MENFKIIKVFDGISEEISNKIIQMLTIQDKLPLDIVVNRIKEMLFVAIDDNGDIVGTCSGHPEFIKELNGWFLYYRSFTSIPWRDSGISYSMINHTKSYFNSNRILNGTELKGIYVIFESPILNQLKNYIIPRSGLTLIGFTERGLQKRVFYFDDAKF